MCGYLIKKIHDLERKQIEIFSKNFSLYNYVYKYDSSSCGANR